MKAAAECKPEPSTWRCCLRKYVFIHTVCKRDTEDALRNRTWPALKYYTPWYTPCIHCPSHLLSLFILWRTLDLCILKNHPCCLEEGYCPILGFTRLILKTFGTVVESHIQSAICVMRTYLTPRHEIHGGALMENWVPWKVSEVTGHQRKQ